MSRTVQVGDDAVAIAARASARPNEYTVSIGETHLHVGVRVAGDGTLLVTCDDGRTFTASVSRESTTLWVTAGGRTTRIREAVGGAGGAAGADGGGHGLEAPMPGKVLRVACAAGEAVTQGQTLVIVEAMKMEHAVKAPRDGVVAEVRCEEGALVGAGEPLVILEDADAGDAKDESA
ncbi:MAG: acetyl-CoA carboxylase biotin carboxyl carrier protein subunit [Deltaproteobacteria bacterium]|nr:MAG: acetyl-CoA carboxylase biotin carboxyl carrier protein subunit [Deltaproteobacteria bacterium]